MQRSSFAGPDPGRKMGCVVSMRPRRPVGVPVLTARMARAAFPRGALAIRIRDELGELFADERFAAAFGVRGKPGISPAQLAMVTVLQFAENLTDRQAAEAVRARIDWKYCLALELDDPGFDFTVLSQFRTRLLDHGLEELALDLLLAALQDKGLVAAGGKQRTDSTHVISAVRDLNRTELAGETVRAALEALAVAAPGWLATAIDVSDWNTRYGRRVDSWRMPSSKTKREELAGAYGTDGYALLRAVYAPDAPGWLAELPAVEVLRVVLLQNYTRTLTSNGREVITRREAEQDGLPPGRLRVASPYDLDARWAAKGEDLFWCGYKVHYSETCGTPPERRAPGGEDPGGEDGEVPNIITNVAVTHAAVPDVAMTAPIHQALEARDLLPGEHYVDSGYPSVPLVAASRRDYGVTLISPLLADVSAQARAGTGFDRAAFCIDFDTRTARCPQGHTSSSWSPCRQRGTEAIVIKFDTTTCAPCPVRAQCTTARRGGRQLTVPPRELHAAQQSARAEQNTADWQAKYAIRAGAESTMHQAVTARGARRARYRGLAKNQLQQAFSAVALNMIRLDAHWTCHPLDRTRTSHLTRLHLALAA
ncbi:IS1182 family transposase [Rhodococcus sp. IEGM 1351]|uniref:IS1182 family transposase n=1 Tax=Rhodococcus sp. IEGM 1351 TaxID=3047089 RepID=UPI0024B676E6|nr:IS1182 family transposase [Rhodococcus sp. IEGM 1351]